MEQYNPFILAALVALYSWASKHEPERTIAFVIAVLVFAFGIISIFRG